MKPRWKLWIALAMFAAICVFPLLRSDSHARKAVEQTRRALHQQSFKTELAEFTFSTAPELRQRAAVLTNADFHLRATGVLPSANFPGPSVSRPEQPNLMETLGLNSALALWKEDKLPAYSGGDRWSKLHEMLDINKAELDAACRAALSGPIRFDLYAGTFAGIGMNADYHTLRELGRPANRGAVRLGRFVYPELGLQVITSDGRVTTDVFAHNRMQGHDGLFRRQRPRVHVVHSQHTGHCSDELLLEVRQVQVFRRTFEQHVARLAHMMERASSRDGSP